MSLSKQKIGVLLVNLGTPDSPKTPDVRRYLKQFLLDHRVIDIPAIPRNLLVRGIIAPFRAPKSAATYRKIWTDKGSPLLIYGKAVAEGMQKTLGNNYVVELAMRYGNPSIASGLIKLRDQEVTEIKIITLYPQYASSTVGAVHEEVMRVLSSWQTIIPIQILPTYHNYEPFINLWAQIGEAFSPNTYDHVIFSFHGLPVRQLKKADLSQNHCQKVNNCCAIPCKANRYCYGAQCTQTAQAIATKLSIPEKNYTICYQSRLGRDPWIQPYTSEIVENLAKKGFKKVLVFCPAFTADCLETIFEIAEEYAEEFIEAGGEVLKMVPSLNDRPEWIKILSEMVINPSLITTNISEAIKPN